jgi:hypothetical protein
MQLQVQAQANGSQYISNGHSNQHHASARGGSDRVVSASIATTGRTLRKSRLTIDSSFLEGRINIILNETFVF